MPSASDELREQMIKRFGDIDTAGPCKFLEDAGYKLDPTQWTWSKPGMTSDYKSMTREEFDCLLFLVHEWDFGGFNEDQS